MQTINNVLLDYFSSFARKDFTSISEYFDDKIELIDWNGTWKGSGTVKSTLNSIANTADIIISPVEIILSQDDQYIHATCVIDIVSNGTITKVVDVIRFTLIEDEDPDELLFMISRINAFKQ